MDWKKEWKPLFWIIVIFLACFYLPIESERFNQAILESFYLVKWYAREHVLLCLVPAFFIAGGIAVFVSSSSVMKYLGPKANKMIAYGVASVSGAILAVCSCTILPLFAGIYKMGAGIGPACTFLYAGPAINILAIILTARVLGLRIGIARAVAAIGFSIVIGVIMHLIYRKEELAKVNAQSFLNVDEESRPIWQTALYFASMVGILVFANFAKTDGDAGLWHAIHTAKWYIVAGFSVALAAMLVCWFDLKLWKVILSAIIVIAVSFAMPDYPELSFTAAVIALSVITSTSKGQASEWFISSWSFAKLIMPLLFIGVLIAGLLLGRPGHTGLIQSEWISSVVGGNSFRSNFIASAMGAFMYFATLTEVPILQGLMGNGMGDGPALALLLAGPALSLPNMLVIRSVMGTQKTIVFVTLVIVMATLAGIIYGSFFSVVV